MKSSDFLPIHEIRSRNMMWFLGAGASFTAGIPTAWDMTWDFKRKLYCIAQRLPLTHVQNLSDSTVRDRLQRYFDSQAGYPEQNADDEYAFYFEKFLPSPMDRRQYIEAMVTKGSPSYGHRVLASLLHMSKLRYVWTTNFDTMVEDSFAQIHSSSGSGGLSQFTLNNAAEAPFALQSNREPALFKLHGDFRSERLKNTTAELQSQNSDMKDALVAACKSNGLAVIGYSGRDASIMDALEEVLDDKHPFPYGLFWFNRKGSRPLDRVCQLIEVARQKNVEAHVVEIDSFDELMSDLMLLESNIPLEVTEYLDSAPKRLTGARVPSGKGSYPIIRFNALNVSSWPNSCRLVKCSIGNDAEIREVIENEGGTVIARRRQMGVLAFGEDDELRRVFDSHELSGLDRHEIAVERLGFDSQELGLLYESLVKALGRNCSIRVERRKRKYFLVVDESRMRDAAYANLRRALNGSVHGIVPKTQTKWWEAVSLKLEFRRNRLWLIYEPTIWFETEDGSRICNIAKEFRRKKLTARYNNKWATLLDGWSKIIVPDSKQTTYKALGIAKGTDATFQIIGKSGFSRFQTS